MTSRERVLCAIAHNEPDRLPRDFDAKPEKLSAMTAELSLTEAQIREKFRCDMDRVWLRYNSPYADGRNIWGMQFAKTDTPIAVSAHPLAHAQTIADVEAHAWPQAGWADVARAKSEAEASRKAGRAVACSSWGSIFGESYRLMGMDNFMMAMAINEAVAESVVAHVTDYFPEVDRRLFTECRGLIDLSFHGNDFGTQRSLLFSREMFRRFFAPNIRRLADQAHSFGLKTMYHSCGAVREVIPDLIDCGVDVLDPIQATADGMEASGLKRDFGARLTFHGGVSTQGVLPFGTPGDVRAEVKRLCGIMRAGGGYIFAPDQGISEDTPTANILAMYDALDELGW